MKKIGFATKASKEFFCDISKVPYQNVQFKINFELKIEYNPSVPKKFLDKISNTLYGFMKVNSSQPHDKSRFSSKK